MSELTWDGKYTYYAELEDGRTLYVSGDAVAEADHEYVEIEMKKSYPDLSQDKLRELIEDKQSEESKKLYVEAQEQNLDSDSWLGCAIDVDKNGDPLEPINSNYVAWIYPVGAKQ